MILVSSLGDRLGHSHKVPLSSAATMYAPASRELDTVSEDSEEDATCFCVWGVAMASETISELASDSSSCSLEPAEKL